MNRHTIVRVAVLLGPGFGVAMKPALGQSNVDPAHKFAWGENIGWTNWQHDAPAVGDGVVVHNAFLSGYIWGENVGWINVGDGTPAGDCDGRTCYANDDGTDFGVNVDFETGEMFGMAWGENIGWVNFDTVAALGPQQQQARLDLCNNTVAGYAWGENIGWLNLDDVTHFVGLGPDCAAGDAACDGVIGLSDFLAFENVLMGPDIPVDCSVFDFDADGDVDLLDFADFQAAFGS